MLTSTAVRADSDNDVLFRPADQFPLGASGGVVPNSIVSPSGVHVRPFGLTFAAVPVPTLAKHSTGQTSTKTSDGHKSMDSDTDHTED